MSDKTHTLTIDKLNTISDHAFLPFMLFVLNIPLLAPALKVVVSNTWDVHSLVVAAIGILLAAALDLGAAHMHYLDKRFQDAMTLQKDGHEQ